MKVERHSQNTLLLVLRNKQHEFFQEQILFISQMPVPCDIVQRDVLLFAGDILPTIRPSQWSNLNPGRVILEHIVKIHLVF